MQAFLQRHAELIQGVLSGFDRLRMRGTLRLLQTGGGVITWLGHLGLKVSGFTRQVDAMRKRLIARTTADAKAAGRPVIYQAGKEPKEELIQEIRAAQGAAENGLIAVLSTLELTHGWEVYRTKDRDAAGLNPRPRKCLHYYFYYDDGRFGLTQVRLATYFPFNCHVMLNGREWLARELDDRGVQYERRDNCFLGIADVPLAQALLARQPKLDWPGHLSRVLRRAHPLHAEFFGEACPLDYYWTPEQTEWATDILFRDCQTLPRLYPQLLRARIETFHSPDVLRFLGHKLSPRGNVLGSFKGEVESDLKRRLEGVRIKHRVGKNSVKMYDKQQSLLRVETTLNSTSGLKSYRRADGQPRSPRRWRPLRKGVADLPRRAELSQAANERYLEALAVVSAETPLKELTDKLCRPVTSTHTRADGTSSTRRHRGLRLLDTDEQQLLKEISRGEHLITGFRNRDLRLALFGPTDDKTLQRRQSAQISRRLALLRAHGLIKKIPRTQRYQLTSFATQTLPALLALLALPQTPLSTLAA